MMYLIVFMLEWNRLKLEKIIYHNESYNKILKQSRKVDRYINIYMKKKLN